ncbi:HAMP domain-containing sensor histidine kinase [Bacillus smithii]|uniref:sensor histidine kinase n=1 Tax=Bacillus smithii TaxID=1479 RepID=UPI0030C98F4A
MFQKTRLRLVLINAAVFLFILSAFGTILYFYMNYRLERQADITLQHVSRHIIHEHLDDVDEFLNPENNEENHRIVYLIWGKNQTLQKEIPEHLISNKDKRILSKVQDSNRIRTIKIGKFFYLTLNIPVHQNINLNGTPQYVQNIQLVYNMEHEKEMLAHLLVFVEFGSLVSVAVAILAGFFLANVALVPIKTAWNKQTQFVADASHELRTPLSVMKLNLERLFRHPKSSIEQVSENISQAINEIEYMTKIITQLLTLARSDSNQLEMRFQIVELSSVLKKVIQDFEELAKLKNITIISSIQSPVEINGDEDRLYQLFMILLDNALKYNKEKGKITVECHLKGSNARIVIKDTGVGISKEDLPFIFDRFYRGDKARTRKYEGTGLGLSIAKWIIDSHGGKIRVTSKVGEGTQFILTFPIVKN